MQPWSERFESVVRASLLAARPDLSLTPATSLSALHLDSLSVMALVTSLECDFKTTLPPDALARGLDTTLGDLWSYCARAEVCVTAA
jgi:acyl carrier protein